MNDVEQADAQVIAEVVVTAAQEPVAELGIFANLVDDLLGNDKPDFDRMIVLRNEAYALTQKAKSINLGELETKSKREAFDWREQEPKDAERQIWNELTEQFKANPAQLDILRKNFLDLQTAQHTREGDPAKKEKFNAMRMAVVNQIPRMKKNHEANLDRADKVMMHFVEQAGMQESYWTSAKDKFEEANIIATLHGWPVTEAKNKK
jgi:hypothetical protein